MRRLLVSVIGVVLLSACGAAATGSESTTAPSGAASGTAVATAVSVPNALAFSAPHVGGGTVDLADYAGKPLLLWFWAPT